MNLWKVQIWWIHIGLLKIKLITWMEMNFVFDNFIKRNDCSFKLQSRAPTSGRTWTPSSYQGMKFKKWKYSRLKHNMYVINTVPKENLLVWNLKDGWEPLCKFLNKPIPGRQYRFCIGYTRYKHSNIVLRWTNSTW